MLMSQCIINSISENFHVDRWNPGIYAPDGIMYYEYCRLQIGVYGHRYNSIMSQAD